MRISRSSLSNDTKNERTGWFLPQFHTFNGSIIEFQNPASPKFTTNQHALCSLIFIVSGYILYCVRVIKLKSQSQFIVNCFFCK